MKTKEKVRLLRYKILRGILSLFGRPYTANYHRILVIAPHPDDEIFGCGGLIIRQIASGGEVYFIFITSGEASHNNCCEIPKNNLIYEREKLAIQSAANLRVPQKNLCFLRWPDGEVSKFTFNPSNDHVISLSNKITEIAPDAIFCPHPMDIWPDHSSITELITIVLSAYHKKINLLYYCTWFWYYLSLSDIFKIISNKHQLIKMGRNEFILKKNLILGYLACNPECGKPYSGTIPTSFIKMVTWNKEVFYSSD